MKKTLVAIGAVAAAGAIAPSVFAQSSTTTRIPGEVTANSQAKIKKSVVVYRTQGVVRFAPGSVILPPGVTDPAYGRAPVCDGQVRVTVYRGGKRLNRKTVALARTCTYLTSNTVSRKRAYGKTIVRVAYLGGTDIIADTAPSQSFQIPKLKKRK